jgi:anti-sigma factor RsiW
MNVVDTIRSRLDEGDVTCEALITFLFEYLSSELTPERERAVEEHLAECPSCVAYLKSYKRAMALGRAALGEPAERPAELAPELVRAILGARR